MRKVLLLAIAALITPFSASTQEANENQEIVVTAPDQVLRRLMDRMERCEIRRVDDCRNEYLDVVERIRYDRGGPSESIETRLARWEQKAIDRLHALDADYNTMYIHGNDHDRPDGTRDQERYPDLSESPVSTGRYGADEVAAHNSIVGRRSSQATQQMNLCFAPVEVSGVTFVEATNRSEAQDFVLLAARGRRADWIALDSIPETLQPTVDAFITSPPSSSAGRAAEARLRNHFGLTGASKKAEEDHRFFAIMRTARASKIRVVATGVDPVYQERGNAFQPIIQATRNRVAARLLPAEGNGLVLAWPSALKQPRFATLIDQFSKAHPGVASTVLRTDRNCELSEAQASACRADITRLATQKRCSESLGYACVRMNAAALSSTCKAALETSTRSTGGARPRPAAGSGRGSN